MRVGASVTAVAAAWGAAATAQLVDRGSLQRAACQRTTALTEGLPRERSRRSPIKAGTRVVSVRSWASQRRLMRGCG